MTKALQNKVTRLGAKLSALAAEHSSLTGQLEAAKIALEAAQADNTVIAIIAAGLPIGTVVEYSFGREQRRTKYIGGVTAVRKDEKGTLYMLQTGEGFDTVLHTVPAGAIHRVVEELL